MLYIDKIDIIPANIPLKEPFIISKGPIHSADCTFVKIYANGLYGIGEACPFPTLHGENQATTVAVAKEFAQFLLGKDARAIHQRMKELDGLMKGQASIKAAFDIALFDLCAKSVSLPLYAYLNGQKRDDIYTDMTVSFKDTEYMVRKAVEFKEAGFPFLKVKLGDAVAKNDVDRMKAIRAAVGMDIPIRIDANQGWNYVEAMRALNGMADLNIQHAEAPIAAQNHLDLKRICDQSPIPIMGDESIFDHHDAFRLLATQSVSLVNIKLGKSGGILNAMKIAAIAQAAGADCQVGAFCESSLGIAALLHYSMAWGNIKYFDLDSPLMHAENPILDGLVYYDDWRVSVLDAPGHGADIQEAYLKKWSIISVEVI